MPAALWLAILFLARHWVLLVLITVSARRSPQATMLLDGLSWWVLAIELPALALIWAAANRSPRGGGVARTLWAWGRPILALTAVVNIGIAAWVLYSARYWNPWPELFVASCALIDVAIVAGIYTSPGIRQVFAEFPSPLNEPEASSS